MSTSVGQKIIRVLFWLLIIYIALSTSLVWAVQLGLIPQRIRTIEEPIKPNQAEAASLNFGETTFAEQFTKEYYTWQKEDDENRTKRLLPFITQNLKEAVQIDAKEMKYKEAKVYDVSTWNIQEREGEDGIKEITVFADQWLVGNQDTNDKRIFRYLVVPIKKAGNSYRVIDQPFEIPRPVAAQLSEKKEEPSKGQNIDDSTGKKVEEFLRDFWKSYTQDSNEQIGYMMKDQKPKIGYKDMFQFIELSNISTVKEKDNEYKTDFDVLLEDVQSGARVTYHYQFWLVQEKDRFYVLKMKQGEK
ncbi:conjugal transfer protein [Thermoflavimicrobium daqui]|uniref:Conjugal transfer protein n=1 Tax=Thermoflavimicrobium daqui TaxID=2137476 RepID=A0A364K9Q6_9BACL|nr:conjugal transfer protein [Thermoflavimicrobium daqui]RAL27037.1 hypothetical protein DL897_03090 [Thermoflavimicrobium daqui]